jgi:ribokinase
MIGNVTVVGSANVDLVYRVARIPAPGETVIAESLDLYPGGKGLNQAIAARRAGAETNFVAAIGRDDHAELILDVLKQADMALGLLRRVPTPTGTAVVTIEESGENNIVVLAGANGELEQLTDAERTLIRRSAVLVCQLEVPDSVIEDAVNTARAASITVVLNPAPMRSVPACVLAAVDVLIVNELEAEQIGVSDLLLPCLVTTLGSRGALLAIKGREPVLIPARRTIAIDTTGAGDTFVGVFAAAIANGADYEAAARRATVAASLSVEISGAVPSIPTQQAVDKVLSLERVGFK